ncbi:hypothetical protein KR018_009426, partial [Drosophila ironensis]
SQSFAAFKMSLYVVAACLLLASHANATFTMDEMCAQWSQSGYVGNPSNCRAWGYCQGQKVVAWGTCPNDYVYNSQLGACDYANRTICQTSAVSTCAAATSPMYMADPNNCNQYAFCDGQGNVDYGNCGSNAVFYANNQTCAYNTVCPQTNICQFMQNDIFVGDPNNCGSYIACNKGYGTPGTCPSTYTYNLQTGNCQTTNQCGENGSNTGTSNEGQFSVGYQNTTVCASATAGAFINDSSTCYGYYYCATAEGVGVWNSCPTGTHFNPSISQCVSPAAYACPYNRCGNVNASFMTQYNTTCNDYIVCSSLTSGACQTPNLYFDEVNGICTSATLNYTICDP